MRSALIATLVVFAAACAPQAPPAASPPVALVQSVYERALSAYPGADAEHRAPMTPELNALLDQAGAVEGQVLDADPVMDANDPSTPENLVVTEDAPAAGGHVTVTARFTQAGQPTVVHFDLVERDGAWLIDNIRSDRGADLRANLQAGLAAAAPSAAATP